MLIVVTRSYKKISIRPLLGEGINEIQINFHIYSIRPLLDFKNKKNL